MPTPIYPPNTATYIVTSPFDLITITCGAADHMRVSWVSPAGGSGQQLIRENRSMDLGPWPTQTVVTLAPRLGTPTYAVHQGVSYDPTSGSFAAAGQAVSTGGGATSVRAVARTLAPPQQISAGNNQFSVEDGYTLTEAVNGLIEIWWPNFVVALGGGAVGGGCSDVATGGAFTGAAQVSYTAAIGGATTVASMVDKIGGTAAISAVAGGWIKATAYINAAAGTVITPRIAGAIPGGVPFSLGKASPSTKFQFGTTAIPIGTTPVPSFPSFRAWYGPCLIAAVSSGKPVGAILSDSTDDGLKDMMSDATNSTGVFMRLFASAGIACVNLSGRGERAQSLASAANSPRRNELLAYATFPAVGTAINDLTDTTSAASILAYNDMIAARTGLSNPMFRTATPFTSGGIVTPWSSPGEAQRQGYNTGVRAKAIYFDPDAVLAAAGGGWTNEDSVAIDWLHPTAVGDAYAATNGAVVGTTVATHGIAARSAGAVMPGWGTNLIATFNRDISNGVWTKNAVTVVTGQADPECGSTAMKIQETATTADHGLARGPVTVSAGTYELWADVAAGGRDWAAWKFIDSSFTLQSFLAYNVTTGVVGATFNTAAGSMALSNGSIVAIAGPGGFYRCKATLTIGAGITAVYLDMHTDVSNLSGNSFLGDVTKGIVSRPQWWLRKVA